MSGDVFYVSRVRGAFDLEPPISLGLITDQHPPIQVARLIQMVKEHESRRRSPFRRGSAHRHRF